MDILIYFLISFIQPIFLFTPEAVPIMIASNQFGPFIAFTVGYLGIITGGVFVFLLGYFGLNKLLFFVNKDKVEKFSKTKASKNNFLLFLLFIFPILPDDIICVSSGIIKYKIKSFVLMFLISKFITTLIYAYFFDIYNSINELYLISIFSLLIIIYFILRRKFR